MSEAEMTKLEDEFPALAAEATRRAYAAALAVGSVLVADGDALVEVFPDGRRVFIKALPPQHDIPVGTVMTFSTMMSFAFMKCPPRVR